MNIFDLPARLPAPTEAEILELLYQNQHVQIERIVSTGQVSAVWYDQTQAEWVILLQGVARLRFDDDEGELCELSAGDYVFISAHRKHKVVYSSTEPPCIWLALMLAP